MKASKKIVKILNILNRAYGKPPPLRKTDPVDELVRTVLSQNTSDANSLAAFAVLKKRFRSWDALLGTRTERIASLIRHGGLANIKAKRIKSILSEIRVREGGIRGDMGKISLSRLAKLGTEEAFEYLRSLKGVGPKTASCVLLFSFGKSVMPVDTHIFRVAKRLGLLREKTGIDQAHRALSSMVPKHLIYEFHLGIIEHGRKTCKSQGPRCGSCVIYELCRFKDKKLFKQSIVGQV